MKRLIMLTAVLFLMAGMAHGQIRKAKLQAVGATSEMTQFYNAAVQVAKEEGSMMSKLQKKIKATSNDIELRHYHAANITLKRGYALAKDVKNTRGKMTATQYAQFQREQETVENELDKLAAGGTSAAGDPKPGTLGECWKSCNDAVGKGFGGGKGWDRFTCKAGCIITNYP